MAECVGCERALKEAELENGEVCNICDPIFKEEVMAAAKQAKQAGLTLEQVSTTSGVPIRTLQDWVKTKPKLFSVIISGCTLAIDAALYRKNMKGENNDI